MFLVHATPTEFKITGHFGFMLEENSEHDKRDAIVF